MSKKYYIETFLDKKKILKYYGYTTHHELLKINKEDNNENVKHMSNRIKTTVFSGVEKCLKICENIKKKLV